MDGWQRWGRPNSYARALAQERRLRVCLRTLMYCPGKRYDGLKSIRAGALR